jgi:glycosyltransferase involved in cell wall biosynthesis
LGGAEQVAIHSLRAIVENGHQASLISERFDTAKLEDFLGCQGVLDKVEKLSFPVFNPLVRRGLLLYQQLYYFQRETRRILGEHRDFDLILSTQDVGYVPSTNTRTIQYCYFPDYFAHVHESPAHLLWNLYYSPARAYYHERVGHVNHFLSVSDYTGRFIRKVWGRQSTTLYPPCPIEQYMPSGEDKENLVVTIGRMVPEKRMHDFLEIASRSPSYRFAIIGAVDGKNLQYYYSLRKRASANVSFILSPLRRAKDILRRAKVYVHCARNEQFGIAIVEAMAAGCVPVVHDSGGPPEIVKSDVGFTWKNTDMAISQIANLFAHDHLRVELSKRASDRAAQFSSHNFESKILEILEKRVG